RRNADAVAVAGDPRHHVLEEVAIPLHHRIVGLPIPDRTETKGVQARDGARAHGQDIADDAADSGRRALVRLDRRWVVVRLDLHGHADPVADVDDAGVLQALAFHRLLVLLE